VSEVCDIGATAAYQTMAGKRGISLYTLYELCIISLVVDSSYGRPM